MVKRADNALQGMAEICAYVNRSQATVLRWIRELGFPAVKIAGGTWESDKDLVDAWRRKQIEGETVNVGAGKGAAAGGERENRKGEKVA